MDDQAVLDLEKEGIREGDYVPNRGTLLPDGTFDNSVAKPATEPTVLSSQIARDNVADNKAKLSEILQPVTPAIKPGEDFSGVRQREKDTADKKMTDDQRARELGGITADEANSIFGGDLSSLKFDQGSGLFFADPSKGGTETPVDQGAQYRIDRFRESSSELATANTSVDSDYDKAYNELESMKQGMDADLAGSLSGIQAKFDQRRTEMKDINMRLLSGRRQTTNRYDGGQYTADINDGILYEEERQGLDRIREIDAEERAAVIAAKEANRTGKFDILSKQIDIIEKKREEKQQAIKDQVEMATKINKDIMDQAKEAREQAKANQDSEKETLDSLSYGVLNMLGDDKAANDSIYKTLADVYDIDVNKLKSKVYETQIKVAKENASVGDVREWQDLMKNGSIPTDMGFFEYYAKKKAIDQTKAAGGAGSGEVSGEMSTDAQSVLSGALDKTDLPTKGGYRGQVMAEVDKKRQELLKAGDFVSVLRSSAVFDKEPDTTFLQQAAKTTALIGQFGELQSALASRKGIEKYAKDQNGINIDMSPISGIWKGANPWDTDSQKINAILQSVVPNLARGVYGEVGVLTDNDIANYKKTLPNLRSTEELKSALLGITLRSIQRSLEQNIKVQVAGQRDMSGFAGVYEEVKAKADSLLAGLEGKKQEAATVKVGGKDVAVGSVITRKSDGKKARVNADGTITPI